MNNINNGKILVGSVLKGIRKAKKTGYLNLKEIALFNIINNLKEECEMNYSTSLLNHLDSILRTLQNKYPEICNYRKRHKTASFVSPIKELNLNTIKQINSKPTVSQDGCLTYNNEEYTFTFDDVTQNYSDLNNDLPKYIKITTLPNVGTLTYNNINVIPNQIILLSDISNLKYFYNNPFGLELNTSFGYQIGDNNQYTQFSNIDTFNICADEVVNTAPVIENINGIFDENLCFQFSEELFQSIYNDVDNNDADNIKFTTLISDISSIAVNPGNWNSSFTFDDLIFPIEDSSNYSICIPNAPTDTSWKIVDNKLVQYDTPDIEQELIDCAEDGYIVDSISNDYTYNLSKTTINNINNSTNIYAFLDVVSLSEDDGVVLKRALQTWFDNYSVNNPDYSGNLYIIPTDEVEWLKYGIFPQDGQITVISLNQWGNIQELPININTPNWTPDNDVIVLGFVNNSSLEYHSDLLSDGFGSIVQPTLNYTTDYNNFNNIYNNYEFFRGLLYPVVNQLGTDSSSEALVLQSMAAIEGDILTQTEIDQYNTAVDVSPLLSSNPYSGLTALKDLNWGAILDKVGNASDVFTAETFELDIEDFLESTSETIIEYKTIDALNNYESVVINFEINDNHPTNPLYSNQANITLTFNQENQLPTFGNGNITINAEEEYIFNKQSFTSNLDPKYYDADGDPIYSIIILSLPEEGTLTNGINDEIIKINDEVLITDVDKGYFKFIPDENCILEEVNFDFNIIDKGSI